MFASLNQLFYVLAVITKILVPKTVPFITDCIYGDSLSISPANKMVSVFLFFPSFGTEELLLFFSAHRFHVMTWRRGILDMFV